MSIAVVVANANSELARAVHDALHRTGVRCERVAPDQLGDIPLTIDAGHHDGQQAAPRIRGTPLGAVLWMARPDGPLSSGWPDEDRAFVDAELRSAWLAVLDHPDVFAVNAFDADMWFEGALWPACRRALHAGGAAHAAIGYGKHGHGPWLPFQARELRARPAPAAVSTLCVPGVGEHSAAAYLAVFGDVIPVDIPANAHVGDRSPATGTPAIEHSHNEQSHNEHSHSGEDTHAITTVAQALQRYGIQLAMLFVNARSVVQWVDPLPAVPASITTRAAHRIAERIHAHLSGR